MRSYGKVVLREESQVWEVRAEPHILMRLKSLFPRILKTMRGAITLTHNDEVCRDLEWFMKRYKLDIELDCEKALHASSVRHQDTILRLEQIVDIKYKPRTFKLATAARKYQCSAAEVFLARGSLLLADDVGIGKTATALCALTDPKTLPAVVVTLSGTMPQQWGDECRKFLPHAVVHIIRNGEIYEFPKRKGRGPDIIVLNYHKLAKWADVLAAYANTIIFDECQELRRSESQKYIGASIVAEATKYRLGLSATPIYNYGGEIWNVINVLRPGALGNHAEFMREWCSGGYARKLTINDPKAFGTYLRENFILLRRTRKEVGRELPPLTKISHRIATDREPLEKVRSAAAELAQIILADKEIERGDRMRAGGELDWKLRHATGVAKAPHVADFIRLLVESGESVVVYAWHRAVYDILLDRLKEYNPACFTGEESAKKKGEAKRRFVERETPVIFVSLRAGAGVDGFQKVCRTVVYAELDWSPGVLDQCTGRVFRDGQPDPVTAYYLVSDEGSDPVVAETLGIKREQVEGIKDPTRELISLQTTTARATSLAKRFLAQSYAQRKRRGPKTLGAKVAALMESTE